VKNNGTGTPAWVQVWINPMTDNRQLNSELAPTDSLGSLVAAEIAESQNTHTVVAESNRSERRRLIRAAVASVPVVLTFTAGKARAQGGPSIDSGESLKAPETPLGAPSGNSNAGEGDGEGDELTPAEKLETFGLQRAEDHGGQDPFRDLDTVSEPVDLSDP
jgi:hypothetical protein